MPFTHVRTVAGIDEYRHDENGLTVLLLQDRAAPVATFMITYHVGSRNEGPGTTGATHLLEHLMFKGTERHHKRAGASIFNVLQRVGAQINATTWLDRTNYYELLPREHLEQAIVIEADRMRGALIDPDDLASERTVVLNEFDRGDNDPLRKLYQNVWSAAFVAHPYHHPTIGWRSDIEHVSRDALKAFYDTYYWPNNATASVIGDFETEDALALIDEYFGAIPASPHEIPAMNTREPEQRGERRITLRQPGELGAVMHAYKMPDGLHPDTDALDVLARILASGKNSRFYRELTDKGLTTYAYASAGRHRDPGLFAAYCTLTPDTTHETLEAGMNAAVDTLKRDGVTEAELRRAQAKVRAMEAFGRDGPYAVAAQLNEAIAAGDWTLYATYLDRIERVTVDDVNRVANDYLVEHQRTVGHYIPISD
ncbi:MAG: pitrilysin family protein [Bacteroidota bacterium]